MFLPYFIAILLGFVSPSNTNHSASCSGTTTVSTADNNSGDPGDMPPGDDTGGDTGNNPPR